MRNHTLVFLLFLVHRAGSGVGNGALYGHHTGVLVLACAVMALALYYLTRQAFAEARTLGHSPTRVVVGGLLVVGCHLVQVVVFLTYVFHLRAQDTGIQPGTLFDLHLWTWVQQSVMVLALLVLGFPWWALLCTVAPAVLLQKLGVNLLGGHPWYYTGTNDPDGSHWNVPLLGWDIPRLWSGNMTFRLVASVVSVAAFFLLSHLLKPRQHGTV